MNKYIEFSLTKNLTIPVSSYHQLDFKNDTYKYLCAFNKNLESLGFTLDIECFESMQYMRKDDFFSMCIDIIATCKKLVGDDVKHRPYYPNFPHDVKDNDNFDMYIESIVHYLTGRIPSKEKFEILFPYCPTNELKIIKSEPGIVKSLFTTPLATNASTTPLDKEIIAHIIDDMGIMRCAIHLPDEIPYKENMALIGSEMIKVSAWRELSKLVKTPTDLLRCIVHLGGGDVSLADKQYKTPKFTRSMRTIILGMIDDMNNPEDMFKYKSMWIKLGGKLHPGEKRYKKRFSVAFNCFDQLRNNRKEFVSYNSGLEMFYELGDVGSLCVHLSLKPGVFARNLDRLLRSCENFDDEVYVADQFSKVIGDVSTPVLIQCHTHFKHTNNRVSRTFFPKGNVAKLWYADKTTDNIPGTIAKVIVFYIKEELTKRYNHLHEQGETYYIDPELKKYIIPFNNRAAEDGLRCLVPGTRVKLDNSECLRFFMHWKNTKSSRVDLDLSAVMYKDGFDYHSHMSWTRNYNSTQYKAYFSGDITNAPDGASEFIDINKQDLLDLDVRYIVMSIFSYTDHPFEDIPECFAGVMGRDDIHSGAPYEPLSVLHKFNLTGDKKVSIPMIIDLQENEMIWCNVNLNNADNKFWNHQVETHATGMINIGRGITEMNKPNFYDLLEIKCGDLLEKSPEHASVVYVAENVVWNKELIKDLLS